MTTGEITKMGLQMQEKTQESTSRAKKLIQETIEVLFEFRIHHTDRNGRKF